MNVMDFKFKKVFNAIGIIAGFIAIRYSAVIRKLSVGSYERSEMYGGDAYTGIQNAAAQTANNVNDLAVLMQTGISYMLLIGGLIAVCYFMSELLGDLSVQGLSDFIQNVSSGTNSNLPKMDGNSASSGATASVSAIAGAIKERLNSGNKEGASAQTEPSPSAKEEQEKTENAPVAAEKEVETKNAPVAAEKEAETEDAPADKAEEAKTEEAPVAAAEEAKTEEAPVAAVEETKTEETRVAVAEEVQPQDAPAAETEETAPAVTKATEQNAESKSADD